MSVVGTWNWDKLKSEEDMPEMDANTKVCVALCEFERVNGIRPNRITMGYHLLDEVINQFYDKYFAKRTLEEVEREQKIGVCFKYEGIPVKVDYDNPDMLEVGYMVKWMENKH